MPAALVQAMICQDDSYWNFVKADSNFQLVTYYCKDVAKARNKAELCDIVVGATKVNQKCPVACGTCPPGSGGCQKKPADWVDSKGDDCSWYAASPRRRCAQADRWLNGLQTATIVCCECGGGCANFPLGWHDSDGSTFTCEWYEDNDRCSEDGESFEHMGFTANQACCTCGGGFQQTAALTDTTSLEGPEVVKE